MKTRLPAGRARGVSLRGVRGAVVVGLLLLGGGALVGCHAAPPDLSTRLHLTEVEPQTVADWILQGRNDFVIVDLRSDAELQAGALPGALHIPAERFPAELKKLPDYKKLVFVTASGMPEKSLLESALLSGLHVLALKEGYAGWKAQVLTSPDPASGVSPEAFARRDTVAKYFRGEATIGDAAPAPKLAPAAAAFVQAAPPAGGAPVKKEGC